MPDERVSDDEHPALFTKLNKPIGSSKVVFIRLRMDQRPLENIFRSDAVEVSANDLSTPLIVFKDLSPVQRRPNLEVILKNILQRSLLRRDWQTHHQPQINTRARPILLCAFCAFLWLSSFLWLFRGHFELSRFILYRTCSYHDVKPPWLDDALHIDIQK